MPAKRPKYIELLVVGTEKEVDQVLRDRGFHPTDVLGLQEHKTIGQCTVYVKAECEPGVKRWFSERLPIRQPGCLISYME